MNNSSTPGISTIADAGGTHEPSQARRYVEVLAFLAVWMACGWLLRLDANQYLLLGLALTLAFNRFVRRQTVRALWVRHEPPFRFGRVGVAIALGLAILPVLNAVGGAVEGDWIEVLFSLCSIGGAIGAAYALRSLRSIDLGALLGCLVVTLALDALQWTVFLGFGLVEIPANEGGLPARVAVGVVSLIQYMAVVFAMEEVSFRMLDGHLHEADRGRGVLSATLLAAVWGLWHLPIGEDFSWQTVLVLLYVHVPYGVALSLFWRRSGNLVVPGLCHALGDSIRNAITAGA